MNRLEKELKNKGLIWEADDLQIAKYGMEYDDCQKLVHIDRNVIVCIFESAVLDSEFRIYDRNTFDLIAIQGTQPETMFFGNSGNKWQVYTDFSV